MLRKNEASLLAVSAAGSWSRAASDAVDCGDSDTTTSLGLAGAAVWLASRTFRSSSWLCCAMSTVSADVTQPLQARQSSSETLARSSLRAPPS